MEVTRASSVRKRKKRQEKRTTKRVKARVKGVDTHAGPSFPKRWLLESNPD
jgi:hypothetical protein